MVRAVFVLSSSPEQREGLERTLFDVSDPKSVNYGKWLTAEQLRDRVAPSAESIKKVVEYIESHGLTSNDYRISSFQDLIFVGMPVNIANRMFNTEFGVFRSILNPDIVLTRVTRPYFLPTDVAPFVSLVDDILRFPSLRRPLMAPPSETYVADSEFDSCGTKCSGLTTPAVLESAYSYSPIKTAATGNSMSVAEFQFQYYDTEDLNDFGSACGVTAEVDTTIGGNVEKLCLAGGCVEALLDIEYIEAVAYPIPLTVYYSTEYSLLGWIDGVMSLPNPPLVNSVSYGNDEAQQTSTEYMYEVNNQFAKAGAMGLSILFASGDQGVWGREGVGATYHPDFPAAAPYVTAVGGTNFVQKSTIGEETTWNCGGGGFSDTFGTAAWQTEQVQNYLTLAKNKGVLPSSSLFNSSGRAYPDVSALGGQTNPYCVAYNGGSYGGVYGTSASCPVVAGIFARVNDARLAAGKSPMGFLNPFIYANPKCFQDVNDGSKNNCYKGTTGFAALDGWDPATGLGTPNFECLRSAALALP